MRARRRHVERDVAPDAGVGDETSVAHRALRRRARRCVRRRVRAVPAPRATILRITAQSQPAWPLSWRLLASPGDGPASVRRYALTRILEKRLSSMLVASSFDLWRMVMYCRVQHELGHSPPLQCPRVLS